MRILTIIGNVIVFIFIGTLLTLATIHLAISYDIKSDTITQFFQQTWHLWLLFRLCIYITMMIGFYLLRKTHLKAVENNSFRRLIAIYIVFIFIIEVINFS